MFTDPVTIISSFRTQGYFVTSRRRAVAAREARVIAELVRRGIVERVWSSRRPIPWSVLLAGAPDVPVGGRVIG